MDEQESKCTAVVDPASLDPNALIPKEKASDDQLVDYILARVMVAAVQSELKSTVGGFTIGSVGRSNRNSDSKSVSKACDSIMTMAECLEDADRSLSRFADLGLNPDECRVLYCKALAAVLARL